MFVFLGEATFSDRCAAWGDAVGWPEVVPSDLPGGGTSDWYRPSFRLDRLQKGKFKFTPEKTTAKLIYLHEFIWNMVLDTLYSDVITLFSNEWSKIIWISVITLCYLDVLLACLLSYQEFVSTTCWVDISLFVYGWHVQYVYLAQVVLGEWG